MAIEYPRSIGAPRRAVLGGGVALLAAGPIRAAARSDDLDGFVIAQMAKAGIPGLALAAVRNGAVRRVGSYGFADLARRRPVTARTMFHIASITKTVTATAVMQLAQEGRLDLDGPVAPHLDFPLAPPITFRHLLTHTSGISDARYYAVDFRQRGRDATQPLGTFVRDYLGSADAFSDAAPGAAWDYSNVGYGLLGYAAGRVAGEDLRVRIDRTIFAPLGVRQASWTLAGTPRSLCAAPYDMVDGALAAVAPVGFPDWPAGMLRMSAADLGRFVAAAADGGGPMLSRATQAQMLQMQAFPGLPDWLTGQGLGWQASMLDGAARANHWGGDPGVFAVAYLNPQTRSAAVVLTNLTVSDASKAAVKAIAARLLAG